MKARMIHSAVALLMMVGAAFAGKLQVVASSSDLMDFAREVGGDRVSVTCLYRGDQDPHAVEPRPSMVSALRQAELVIRVGMELDLFMDSLVEASKNPKIQKGNPGNLDASEGIAKKEVPSGKIDLSMGDVHALGNPHYQTDPENVRRVALAIARRLGQLDPAHAGEYQERAEAYERKVGAAGARWAEALAPFRGAPVVTYHPSWIYFTERFGLKVLGTIEPKPGIPPGAAHLKRLQDLMKSEKVRAILVEPYFDFGVAKRVGAATGAAVLLFPQSAGGVPGAETWIDLMERNVALLAQTLK